MQKGFGRMAHRRIIPKGLERSIEKLSKKVNRQIAAFGR